MGTTPEYVEGLAYVTSEPNMESIREAYERDRSDSTGYFDQCADAYNQRRMWWPGKSRTMRKERADARPWVGASDVEVPVIDPRINTLVALCMNAIRDGHVTALPVGSDDDQRAAATSTFMRWMLDSWIPNFQDEIELSLNNMFEKGIAATFCGWEQRPRKHKELLDINEIAAVSMEMAEMLLDEEMEDDAIEGLKAQFTLVSDKQARRALRELRKSGVAEFDVIKGDIDRPLIAAKDPSADIIWPSYTIHWKDVNRCHIRHFMSIQDLESKVASEDWDAKWVKDVIENHMGLTELDMDGLYSNRQADQVNRNATLFNIGSKAADDLAEIVCTYQRLVDKNGVEGIYRTIWCPKQGKSYGKENRYGAFELLNGYTEIPVAVTTMTRDSKRIYDQRNMCDLLRGNQRQQKVARDNTIDNMSISMDPPRTHPAGRPATAWGAGADFAARRGEEGLYRTLDVPSTMRQGVDLETYLDQEADFVIGLKEDSPISLQRQQYFINRALRHVGDVARLCYKNYQKMYGKDEIHFRITGQPDPQTYNKGPLDEEYDIRISYDARIRDNEFIRDTVERLTSLKNDPSGRVDPNATTDIIANLLVPQYAGRILRPVEEAVADIQKQTAQDLAMIYSGQSVGPRQVGAAIALQYVDQYIQKPSVQEKLGQDAEFAANLGNYRQQLEFVLVQLQNAEVGRTGGQPTDIQS